MSNLEELLWELAINKSNDLEKSFDDIAIEILNRSKLVAGSNIFEIKEIEFYFSSQHYKHIDPYVHINRYPNSLNVKRQAEFGEWYFHRFKNVNSYNWKRGGLDITIGNKDYDNYGGILIREIQNTMPDNIIDGPGCTVKALIHDLGDSKFNSCATEVGKFVFSKSCSLHLENFNYATDRTWSKDIRKINSKIKDNEYLQKKYRYFELK